MLQALAPDWAWTLLGGPDNCVEDPSALLRSADVVVTNAGQSGLADIAAHRRPAIVIPASRPFGEQHATATALASGRWPAVVLARFAVLHVEACQAAARRGLSEARAELRDVTDQDTVESAIQTWHAEAARLMAERRAVGLVEEALRGKRYIARL